MTTINGSDVGKVVIACDAGMGSSALLKAQLSKTLAPYSVKVEHTAVNKIPADADVVLCHQGLADRARKSAPDTVVLPFQMFIGDPVFAKLEAAIKAGEPIAG
ncbi:PTS sugar transporter subunit IIB [Marinitenerispora sediminis]|uniref:PTS lactose transporter subunit IIB n=1 Tax=Marinitenerispora sediminis TaxID=1931232 RepID=A0A368SY38_9ACTN|nr:PTS lactose transporter subunit IIB [Marinitenerispora sediminis]RCV47510.1 PTS lactose transporter subunit IIB [Marinitenerispora sediminis]RCV47752.1 PTS lactose transporter subunit IIB [Marinitenerispora sediminis]RCV48761.1 PTS lactose transporter subunit IIB [Marinitenerispora sediminis]